MSEKRFQAKVQRAVQEAGGLWWKTQDAFKKGLPDSIVLYRGQATWLEYKWQEAPTPTGLVYCKLTAEQRAYLRAWERKGGRAWCLMGVGTEWLVLRHDAPPKAYYTDLRGHALAYGTVHDFSPLLALLSGAPPGRGAGPGPRG